MKTKKEVLFVLLDDYADWECAFLSSALRAGTGIAPDFENAAYSVKTVAPSRVPVRSLGGFRTLPDYDFSTMPDDFAALALIGGLSWASPEAEPLAPIVASALERGKITGAICDAVSFLAAHGFLNGAKHTGNTLALLRERGGKNYANAVGYVEAQAVRDGNVITANGTGTLEFAREMLLALDADAPEKIAAWFDFQKNGFVR